MFNTPDQKIQLKESYHGVSHRFYTFILGFSYFTSRRFIKDYASHHTLGLIWIYHVNDDLSAPKTTAINQDVHGVWIYHQTILNYANIVYDQRFLKFTFLSYR